MKHNILSLLFLSAALFISCSPKEGEIEKPTISVNPAAMTVPYTQTIADITLKSNTKWVVTRTDQTGADIDWVKITAISGKGDKALQVKVLENPNKAERAAIVKFDAGGAIAYLDITQEPNPNDPPKPEPDKYSFPMFQAFTTGLGVQCAESGSVKVYDFATTPIVDAEVKGGTITFTDGLKIEIVPDSQTETVVIKTSRPAHTNPSQNAGFMEGFCATGMTSGTITYTIPFNVEVSGKVRFIKGQRRESGDSYQWSTDDGATWNTVGAATGAVSDAAWKYLDFEIPSAQKVEMGKSLIIKETVAYNSSTTYPGIMMTTGIALVPQEGTKSSVPAADGTKVLFSDGFDDIISAPSAPLLNIGFMKSMTSGKQSNPSYTAAKVATMDTIVTPSMCMSRPGFLQIGYADEALARASSNCYVAGSYKLNIGAKLKAAGKDTTDITVSFKAAGLKTAYGENCNAEPVLTATDGTVSDGGAVALEMDSWKEYSFKVTGATEKTVLELTSNSTTAGALAGKPDNRFFIDDVVVSLGDTPGPQKDTLKLTFPFKDATLNWPVAKTESWATNSVWMDSGLALDNGGTADTTNHHRRAAFKYTLVSKDYNFIIADPDDATAHNIYFDKTKGIYSGTVRYVGLPVIDGYTLVQISNIQGASTKDPSAFNRRVGLSKQIYDPSVDPKDVEWVEGGEMQNQATNNETYTYKLTGSKAGEQYYLYNPDNASIYVSITLIYVK